MRINGRFYFAALGFLVGAYFGSSTGVASAGHAQNGWLIFGGVGAALLYLLTFTVQPARRTPRDIERSAREREETFSNLFEITTALEKHIAPFAGIERDARFYEFFIRHSKFTGNFAPAELADELGKKASIEEIERAQAIARRLDTK